MNQGQSTEEVLEPLEDPPPPARRRGSDLLTGLQLLPEERLKAISADQLELVVGHWLYETTKDRYARRLRVAGPGDKGRDVVAYESSDTDDPWDNFQCKQYSGKLGIDEVRVEIAKLVFYASRGDYSTPRGYYFVAPSGFSAPALNFLTDPEAIRADLLETWDKHSSGLCEFAEIAEALQRFRFPRFEPVVDTKLIEDLKGSPIFPALFGGGLTKPRPPDKSPPDEIAEHELPYIGCLLEAYDEHSNQPVASSDDALAHDEYGANLRASRSDFYCAESLKEFSKDVLIEPSDFESLQNEIHDGIKYTVQKTFPTGYDRVLAVCEQAVQIQISGHPLRDELRPPDRSGICHQLANDKRVRWKNP